MALVAARPRSRSTHDVTVAGRHPDVQQDQVRQVFDGGPRGALAVHGRHDAIPGGSQPQDEAPHDVGLVVGDQDRRLGPSWAAPFTGSTGAGDRSFQVDWRRHRPRCARIVQFHGGPDEVARPPRPGRPPRAPRPRPPGPRHPTRTSAASVARPCTSSSSRRSSAPPDAAPAVVGQPGRQRSVTAAGHQQQPPGLPADRGVARRCRRQKARRCALGRVDRQREAEDRPAAGAGDEVQAAVVQFKHGERRSSGPVPDPAQPGPSWRPTWMNLRTMRSRCCGSIPGPGRRSRPSRCPFAPRTRRRMVPPRGENLRALSSRRSSTVATSSASPSASPSPDAAGREISSDLPSSRQRAAQAPARSRTQFTQVQPPALQAACVPTRGCPGRRGSR